MFSFFQAWRDDADDGNCGDSSFQDNCPFTCNENQFTCPNGKCIPGCWVCDDFKDCHSGADEIDCEIGCDNGEFTCNNGDCIQVRGQEYFAMEKLTTAFGGRTGYLRKL